MSRCSWVNSGRRRWLLWRWPHRRSHREGLWCHSCCHQWYRCVCHHPPQRSQCKWQLCCLQSSWHWQRRSCLDSAPGSSACTELRRRRRKIKVNYVYTKNSKFPKNVQQVLVMFFLFFIFFKLASTIHGGNRSVIESKCTSHAFIFSKVNALSQTAQYCKTGSNLYLMTNELHLSWQSNCADYFKYAPNKVSREVSFYCFITLYKLFHDLSESKTC